MELQGGKLEIVLRKITTQWRTVMNLNMTYIKVYNFMKTQLRLDDKELFVFAFIYSFHETGKKCTTSMSYIARQFDISTKSVMRAINNLKDMGIITTEKLGKILEFKVNESGIYRRVAELAAGAGVTPTDEGEDEDEDEQPTGTYGSEGADGNDFNHARSEGADGNEGAYGGKGAYGVNSTHARGGTGNSRGKESRIPKFASNTAEEALYNALCRTYGPDLVEIDGL